MWSGDIYWHSWLKCAWYFRLVLHHLIIVFFLFSLKSGDRRFDIFVVAGEWYRALSLLPVTAGLSAWPFSIFSAQLTKSSHPVLLCLDKFFTVYHYSTLSLFSLEAGDRRVDGYFVAGGIVICRYDKLRCHRWGCQLDDLLFFGARLTWYSHPILLWFLHNWNVHAIFVYLFYYALISSLPYHYSICFLFHWYT